MDVAIGIITNPILLKNDMLIRIFKITDIKHFSAYDLAKYKKLIFTETSIKELEKRY